MTLAAKIDFGSKLKEIRECRKLTQRDLGIMCGFTEKTADVRIVQYEKNRKIPGPDVIEKMEKALGIKININVEIIDYTDYYCI